MRDPAWIYLAPLWVYTAAALFKILPFSEWVVRLPSAFAGVLNVGLMFLVARELFGRTRPALIAAGLLMATPAHFLQSRIGTGQIGSVTFVVAWLYFMARYLNGGRRRDLWVASFCLGLGTYAYAAGLIILPVYFLVTLVIVHRRRTAAAPTSGVAAACGGFGLAFVPLALWHMLHPEHLIGLAVYYTHGEYNRNLGWGGFFGVNAVSHLDAWWDCYNLDKLFFSGDPDLRFSTRSAGFFLLPVSVLMAVGVVRADRLLKTDASSLLAAGLLLAPLPAAFVSNSEFKRWLTFLPFAILAATCGAEWMLNDRRRVVQASAVALLVLSGIQIRNFVGEYFGDYRVGVAPKFGGNLRGAIQEVLSVSASDDCVLLDGGVRYLREHWDLYARAYGRSDLADRATWMRADIEPTASTGCRATTALALAGDHRFAGWRSTPIPELDGTAALAVYRR